ncbi:hypothetical protein GPECTOR_132g602 [Gonium pectorale]|uniref:Glutaredoxin domain-containing protein n=1 Tax=Gonium pectorale TaxID=33097 RepID=A0A150FZU3_GONPE|nr:hypothetical protein GPECTOR_132g602 [Gonium pectorale]|eukprot:KXZ42590.1 hypothetical protein GPECTOR_132g602 [Gonium pectorale]
MATAGATAAPEVPVLPSDPVADLRSARVAVMSTPACPYCKRAKEALSGAGVSYVDVNVGSDEALRQVVRELTGKRTVPQVGPWPRTFRSFTLRALLDWLAASGEADPAAAARQLLAANLITPAAADFAAAQRAAAAVAAAAAGTGGSVDDGVLLTLVSEAPAPTAGEPLNTGFWWQGPARPASEVASSLRSLILQLYDDHLSPDGKVLRYGALRADPRFGAFVAATAELQQLRD